MDMEGARASKESDEAVFSINGKIYKTGPDLPVNTSLNTFIRHKAHLSGTKFMCGEGSCGSCVVNLKYNDSSTKKQVNVAVNSCLLPVLACHGAAITTVEGLGSRAKGYNKIQTTLAHFNGTQCGYCSPGFVMSMFSLLDSKPNATVDDVENNFSGNICRCTGYRPILDAFKSLSSNPPTKLKQRLLEIEEAHILCPNRGKCNKQGDEERCKSCMKNNEDDAFELDFSELSLTNKYLHLLAANSQQWYRPNNLKEIFEIFDMIENKSYMLLAGNTAKGVKKHIEPDVYIDINEVNDLKGITTSNNSITFGSLTRQTEYVQQLQSAAKNYPNSFAYGEVMADHVLLVANVPVRNRATIGGNLSFTSQNHEFPSDIYLLLDAIGATVTVASQTSSTKDVSLAELRGMNLNKKVITKISLPAQNNSTSLKSYKIMPVSLSAVAIVNAAFLYDVNNDGKLNRKPSLVISGINNDFRHASNTENYISGKNIFNTSVLKTAISTLWDEIKPDDVLPQFSSGYRKLLATGLFYRSILSLAGDRADRKFRSGGYNLVRPISSGKQVFQTHKSEYPLTQPIPKLEAQIQCAGEAKFVSDFQKLSDELIGCLVLAKQFADIQQIDPSEALKMPGVVAFYSAKDIPGKNEIAVAFIDIFSTGPVPLFSDGTVSYWGQPVGIIVATTEDIAEKAADKVVIKYKAAKTPLLTIRDVLNSPEKDKRVKLQINQKAVRPGIGGIHKFHGEIDVASCGQYSHTLETPTCRVIPDEDGQFKVYAATQTITVTKTCISQVMDIPTNKIDCKVPRVGGSFGSKNTSQLYGACSCTLAASKLQKPVRMVMRVQDEMHSTGKRAPFYATYKGKCNLLGKIEGMDLNIYVDYGFSKLMNVFVAVLPSVINYFEPTSWNINVYNVFTDKTPMVILRGPGFTEAIAIIEQIMDHISFVSKLSPMDVRMVNSLDPVVVPCLIDWRKQSDFDSRKKAIDKFNSENRWKKKGIAMTAMRYPFTYIGNQIGCTVGILYPDGTVQVQHGGIEMGQGLNTKVAQAVAHELDLPLSMIQMKQTTSLNCPNNTPTWSSVGSELTVLAAVQCCKKLKLNLAPVRLTLIKPTWQQLIKKAFDGRVCLSETVPVGLFPDGPLFGLYFVYGIAVTETEVDVLTGQHQVTRVDLLEDVGRSMSPDVDVGQIEGGFIMALGLHTTERLVYEPKTGELLTDRLWNYFVPRAKDIPIDLRITFRPNSINLNGVLNSKSTGEPSMALGVSVICSLRYALMSARSDAGLPSAWLPMASPSTPESILLASGTSKEQFIL